MKKNKKNEGFNTPFSRIKKTVNEKKKHTKQIENETTKRDENNKESISILPEIESPLDGQEDEDLFLSMMGDVKPLSDREKQITARPRQTKLPDEAIIQDEDAEVLATLSDLVAGEGDFVISDTEEYVEGIAPGVDRRILRRLRHGDYSSQAYLDLHGMTKGEARKAVETFLRTSRYAGRRCVIIVHGRGLRSPGGKPVLKTALLKWLSRGTLGKQVLAFSSTLAHDGGTGALYVLLRR